VSRRTARVTSGTTPFVAVPQSFGSSVVPVHPTTGGDKRERAALDEHASELKGDVPGAYHSVVTDEDSSDPPLHAVRTAGRQRSEVLIGNEGLD